MVSLSCQGVPVPLYGVPVPLYGVPMSLGHVPVPLFGVPVPLGCVPVPPWGAPVPPLPQVTPLSPCPPRVPPGEKVMSDDEFTQDLFRLLQLLCEGHNNGGDTWRHLGNT